jgi:alpha-beta hydrolase superfamily lysophospholipase
MNTSSVTSGTSVPRRSRVRKLTRIVIIVLVSLFILFCGGLWYASNQLLFPVWKVAGKGDLRSTHEFKFSEVRFRSINGYELPGWLIRASENGIGPAQGAIMLVHGGGMDRRSVTKFIRFFLERGFDVLTFDQGGQGEALSPVPGLTYGTRESRDVLSAYLYLSGQYEKVYAMGTSVGAASILIALPEMPRLIAVIAENPMVSFQRLILETPASKSIPGWFTNLLISVTMVRGKFDGLLSPENSLRMVATTPIYFIHSKKDNIVPYQQTQELADSYRGPKTVWFPDKGNHAAIWEVDRADYEKRLSDFLNNVQDSIPHSIK